MGKFEKLVLLTVLFVGAIALAISLNRSSDQVEASDPLSGARERIPRKAYVLATGYPNDTFTPVANRLRQRKDWRVEEMPYTHDLQHVAAQETAAMIESAIP